MGPGTPAALEAAGWPGAGSTFRPRTSPLIDARWTYATPTGLTVQADFSVKAESLTPRHRRLLPESVGAVMDALDVKIRRSLTLAPVDTELSTEPSRSAPLATGRRVTAVPRVGSGPSR